MFSCKKQTKENVIYGLDHRRDFYQVTDVSVLRNMSSTSIIVSNTSLTKNGSKWGLKGLPFGLAYGLCQNEPYGGQPVVGYCTGFAINDSTIVTAGHCAPKIRASK